MQRLNTLFISVIQFLSLFDNNKQLHVRQTLNTVKAISKTIKSPLLKQIRNTIKNPIIKTFGNTIKNSMGKFRQNKNTIKNISYGLQKKYLKIVHNFGSKSIKYLGAKGIEKFKYKAPQAVRSGKHLFRTESKKNIQMRSAPYISGKELRYMVNRSVGQMKGKGLGSLINMVSKSKPQLPLFFVTGGLNKLTQFNLVPDNNDIDVKSKQDDPMEIQKATKITKNTKEHQLEAKRKLAEKQKKYREDHKERLAKLSKAYKLKNKDTILKKRKEYELNNRDYILQKRREYYKKNKDKLVARRREYVSKNKDKISEHKKKYYEKNKDIIKEKTREYKLKNQDIISENKKKYYQKNQDIIKEKNRKYQLKNKDIITAQSETKNIKNKEKIKVNKMMKVLKGSILGMEKESEEMFENKKEDYLKNPEKFTTYKRGNGSLHIVRKSKNWRSPINQNEENQNSWPKYHRTCKINISNNRYF